MSQEQTATMEDPPIDDAPEQEETLVADAPTEPDTGDVGPAEDTTDEESFERQAHLLIRHFASKYAPQLTASEVEKGASEALASLRGENAAPSPTSMDLALNFRHDCLALGCRDGQCTLCLYNPARLCERNFGKKYLVGDVLKAKCGAPLRVELVDASGQVHLDEVPGVQFEVSLVDGVTFKEKGGETRTLSEEEFKSCFKLTNHRDEALLQHKSGTSNSQRKIILKFEKGQATLPDLQVTDSSEALLTGRRPPFRLCVWAVQTTGGSSTIRYAVSEEFVVATRRVKQANKADIPLVDDHVSKIEHIGRETVKKLSDMKVAATEVGVEIKIPEKLCSIQTVGQFQQLVTTADTDAQLRKVLQIILKLSKEKWEEAANHAATAVVPDFRKRVWYPPGHNMGIGLLFNCKYGAVQLKDPVALVQLQGEGQPSKVVPEDQLDPASLTILRQLKAQAVQSWWTPSHPGWGVFRESPGPEPQPQPMDGPIAPYRPVPEPAAAMAAVPLAMSPAPSATNVKYSKSAGALRSVPSGPVPSAAPSASPPLANTYAMPLVPASPLPPGVQQARMMPAGPVDDGWRHPSVKHEEDRRYIVPQAMHAMHGPYGAMQLDGNTMVSAVPQMAPMPGRRRSPSPQQPSSAAQEDHSSHENSQDAGQDEAAKHAAAQQPAMQPQPSVIYYVPYHGFPPGAMAQMGPMGPLGQMAAMGPIMAAAPPSGAPGSTLPSPKTLQGAPGAGMQGFMNPYVACVPSYPQVQQQVQSQ